MSYSLKIQLRGLPRLNTSDHIPWRVDQRETQQWCDAVHWHCKGKLPYAPLERARLRFTRHSSKEPDRGDNLNHSFKHIRDGLVRAGVIVDDKPEVVGDPVYQWEKAPRGKGFVTIEVWEVVGERETCPECGQVVG